MKKILLVLEDFAERAFLSTLLKKVGWDVEVAPSDIGINNLILSFSPQVVIINGFGKKVKGEFLPHKLSSMRNKPLFFLVTKGRKLTDQQMEQLQVDAYFESPIDIKKLFERLEEKGGISASVAFQKLSQQRKKASNDQSSGDSSLKKKVNKLKSEAGEALDLAGSLFNDDNTSENVSNKKVEEGAEWENPQEAVLRAKAKLDKYRFSDPERAKRNSDFVKNNPLPESKFNGIDTKFVAEQKQEFRELEDDPEIEDIDDNRKAFAVAMFQLGKKD